MLPTTAPNIALLKTEFETEVVTGVELWLVVDVVFEDEVDNVLCVDWPGCVVGESDDDDVVEVEVDDWVECVAEEARIGAENESEVDVDASASIEVDDDSAV